METETHCRRVGAYCQLIAEQLNLDGELIAAAGRLHDIGMAAVCMQGAFAVGTMTLQQRELMTRHTRIGHAILLAPACSPALDLAAEIALTHHEHFDGNGYPNRLSGSAIPIHGRIAAVADAFDALTTDRPYRRASPAAHAVDVMLEARALQFDPRVFDAFTEVINEAANVLRRFAPNTEDHLSERSQPSQLLTLTAAASVLDVAPSRLRRWADQGRVESVRTAGGHRRFPSDAIQLLATELGQRPLPLRPTHPPDAPLYEVAQALRAHGTRCAATAAAMLETRKPTGWFASTVGTGAVAEWIDRTAESCETGQYERALGAVADLVRRAEAHATTLLERHVFLERFGYALIRVLTAEGAARHELAGARRLFAASLQTALQTSEPLRFDGAP